MGDKKDGSFHDSRQQECNDTCYTCTSGLLHQAYMYNVAFLSVKPLSVIPWETCIAKDMQVEVATQLIDFSLQSLCLFHSIDSDDQASKSDASITTTPKSSINTAHPYTSKLLPIRFTSTADHTFVPTSTTSTEPRVRLFVSHQPSWFFCLSSGQVSPDRSIRCRWYQSSCLRRPASMDRTRTNVYTVSRG